MKNGEHSTDLRRVNSTIRIAVEVLDQLDHAEPLEQTLAERLCAGNVSRAFPRQLECPGEIFLNFLRKRPKSFSDLPIQTSGRRASGMEVYRF